MLFQEMKQFNLYPTDVTFNALLMAYAKRKGPSPSHTPTLSFESYSTKHFFIFSNNKIEILFLTVLSFFLRLYFDSLLIVCLCEDFYDDAFKTLAEMKASGYSPDLVTFILLLKTCARGGDARTAEL
jgi:pentatricopeptide repeat protein